MTMNKAASGTVAARGEISLTLEGVPYILRPTFEAIAAIETETGQPLFDLAKAAEQCRLTLPEAGIIAAHCIRAQAQTPGGNPLHAGVQPDSIARRIYGEDGGLLLATRVSLHPLLYNALTGGFTALGERKPSPTTTKK